MKISKLKLEKYKKVVDVELDLEGINVIVGGNNAGKSSVLQGVHFSVTSAAASRQQGQKTFSSDFLLYNPTPDFSVLRNGSPYRNFGGDNSSKLSLTALVDGENGATDQVEYSISLYKGRNHGNIGCDREGEYIRLGSAVTDHSNLFSIYVPGLAGVPQSEELRAKAIVRKGVASGDANLYLRNILYYIKDGGLLNELNNWLNEIFDSASVEVIFNKDKDSHIGVYVTLADIRCPLELCGTGILQILQIISYVTYFNPKVLLLDEPDSHLHPNNQALLCETLQRISEETSTQIILCTHSRHMVEAFYGQANFIWMKDGLVHEQGMDIDKLPILLDIGALDDFDRLQNGEIEAVVLTEDSNTRYLECLLEGNGYNLDSLLIYSYRTSSNLDSANLFANFLSDVANGCKVLIHRDRDFMTNDETEIIEDKIRRAEAIPFITEGSDIESYFAREEHIAALVDVDLEEVLDWTNQLAEHNHVDIQHQFTRKRDDIKTSIYRSNRNECPETFALMGRDIPLSREKRKGKYMIKKIRSSMQEQFGRQVDLLSNSIHIRCKELERALEEIRA